MPQGASPREGLSERRSSRIRYGTIFLAPIILSLGGCADYLERRDTVTFAAGEAQAWNRVVHANDPWPPYVANTRITSDAERVARGTRGYFTGDEGVNAGTAAARSDRDQPTSTNGLERD